MNVIVDKLAKLGLIAGIAEEDYADCVYPFEQIRVTLKGRQGYQIAQEGVLGPLDL